MPNAYKYNFKYFLKKNNGISITKNLYNWRHPSHILDDPKAGLGKRVNNGGCLVFIRNPHFLLQIVPEGSPKTGRRLPEAATLSRNLIGEILTKLPVKDMLRFRCVCKSWDSLIIDPKLFHRPLILVQKLEIGLSQPREVDPYSYLSISCYDGEVKSVFYPWENYSVHSPFVTVAGYCNGLVCLHDFTNSELFLWNPLTRKVRTVPPPLTSSNKWISFSGFGYDKSTDDYKLVTVSKLDVSVFSLKLNTSPWRSIQDPNFIVRSPRCGVFLKGALHWLAENTYLTDSISKCVMVAFDLATTEFQVMPLPELDDPSPIDVAAFEDHLCLCSPEDGGIGVWVMKEYGVTSSWTKWFTFPSEMMTGYGYKCEFNPLFCSREDEILAFGTGDEAAAVVR